jgi:hypothetical protein
MQLTGKLGRWGLAAVALAGLAGGSLLASAPVSAQSPTNLPMARFYGQATVQGQKPVTNLTISALIGTTPCSATQANVSGSGSYNDGSYFVDIQSVPGCTTPGATVTFTVSGFKAKQTGTLPSIPGTPVHLDLDFQAPATPSATAPPPPPPPTKTPTAAPPPPSTPPPARPSATPSKPVVQQAPAGAAGPVVGAKLPNTGTGGLLEQQTAATGWALLVIVLAALGVSATGLVAYRRQR